MIICQDETNWNSFYLLEMRKIKHERKKDCMKYICLYKRYEDDLGVSLQKGGKLGYIAIVKVSICYRM